MDVIPSPPVGPDEESARSNSAEGEPEVQWNRLACLVTLVVLVAVGGYFVLNGALNADEGFYLFTAQLVGRGLRPYHDFAISQGPLLPYVNLPGLWLFGFSLAGIRLTGLAWTLLAVSVGVTALVRSRGWTAAAFFTLLLLGAPGWMEYAVKGKTYAFTSVMLLVGTLTLLAKWPLRWRWTVFIAAAALGTGARLPAAGFFLPAGIGLLVITPTWRTRFMAIVATLLLGALMLVYWGGADWERLVYWTTGIHRGSNLSFSRVDQLRDVFLSAPALWILFVMAVARLRREPNPGVKIAVVSLGLATLANMSGRLSYAEYLFPFLPAIAWTLAPRLVSLTPRWPRWGVAAALMALSALTWIQPPILNPGVVRKAETAAAFLRSHVAAGATVVCSMPEIPVASGHMVPVQLAMGKFALTEEMPAAKAHELLFVTTQDLVELLRQPQTQALVFSTSYNWNFAWSMPSYRWISGPNTKYLTDTIREFYQLGYTDSNYVVMLRKPIASGPPETRDED